MDYLVEAGLLVMTLLFGVLGVRSLEARGKLNDERIAKHLAIQWQDMKGPMPQATYGMTFVYLVISFISLLAFITAISVLS